MIAVIFTSLLSGCSLTDNNDGMFHTFLVNPIISLLDFNATLFHGNYGWSIILMTVIIRLLIMPLTAKQYKTQQAMKGKMDALKPEMTTLQEKIKSTTDATKKAELQREMMQLYQKHGVNPLNMGCLPMLIQMPILMGVYYAIKSSHEIATHSFLWFNLGQANIIMALIAGVIYYLQFKFSLHQMPTEQQQQMKFMGLLSPIMILFISFSAPAALPLYWSVGGLFLIGQSMLFNRIYKKQPANQSTETTLEKS
ncbi:membrane protein insertase YidC [Peribacillus asahii]|nr:membrane protein insertase YidC [Peribacillus asahii]